MALFSQISVFTGILQDYPFVLAARGDRLSNDDRQEILTEVRATINRDRWCRIAWSVQEANRRNLPELYFFKNSTDAMLFRETWGIIADDPCDEWHFKKELNDD